MFYDIITEIFKLFNTNIYKSMSLYQLKILISIENLFDELIYYQENTFLNHFFFICLMKTIGIYEH